MMATPARDIVTKQIDLSVLPSPRSSIVDLQPDPRGGYWALVSVPVFDNDPEPAFLLKFDDTHTLVSTHSFSVTNPDDLGYDAINVAAMVVDKAGIFVVGTALWLRRPGLPSKVFVMRFSTDAVFQGVTVYDPSLFDGCKVPQPVQCTGVGIVRLEAPDDDRLMVLFQTAVAFDGTGLPKADDSIAAGVFTIDNNGNIRGTGVRRIFGRGQVMPSRLRLLRGIGPVIVGRTRQVVPFAVPWSGYYVRLDRDGTVVRDTPYDLGAVHSMVLNDIAFSDFAILTVGTVEQGDGTLRAVSMKIEANGSVDWIGIYGPPPEGPEFFLTQLNVLMPKDAVWIAAGAYSIGSLTAQPWLISLTSAEPGPVWQKWYPGTVDSGNLRTSFQALLHNLPDRAIAGGDVAHRSIDGTSIVFDRIPFLVVSGTAPGTASPRCGNETRTRIVTPDVVALGPTFAVDQMPLLPADWLAGHEEPQVSAQTICNGDG